MFRKHQININTSVSNRKTVMLLALLAVSILSIITASAVTESGWITDNQGNKILSILDGYGCDASYCIYTPWYSINLLYAKNGTTQAIDYSGTDATTVINNALAAAPSGGSILLKTGTYSVKSINVTKNNIELYGNAQLIGTDGSPTINISASNVAVHGLTLIGAGSETYNGNSNAVYINGSSPLSYLSNIKIYDLNMSGYNGNGVYARYISDFDFHGMRMYDMNYSGILVLSGSRGKINNNILSGFRYSPNSYGIAVTRGNDQSLANDPQSNDVTISANHVDNSTIWEAYDTHGGIRIDFIGNTANNTKLCINVGVAQDGSSNTVAGSSGVNVIGNTCNSQRTDGLAGYGITFTGTGTASTGVITYESNGTIAGNTIVGYGTHTDSTSGGAIYVHNTRGLVISGNTIINPSPFGVNLYYNNYGLSVNGNTIKNAWSNSITFPSAIITSSSNNTGSINGNTQFWQANSYTYTNVRGISLSSDASNTFSMFGNNLNATSRYLIGTNNSRSFFAYSRGIVPPTTSDIQDGECGVWYDSVGATQKLFCNIGGALKSVSLT